MGFICYGARHKSNTSQPLLSPNLYTPPPSSAHRAAHHPLRPPFAMMRGSAGQRQGRLAQGIVHRAPQGPQARRRHCRVTWGGGGWSREEQLWCKRGGGAGLHGEAEAGHKASSDGPSKEAVPGCTGRRRRVMNFFYFDPFKPNILRTNHFGRIE